MSKNAWLLAVWEALLANGTHSGASQREAYYDYRNKLTPSGYLDTMTDGRITEEG